MQKNPDGAGKIHIAIRRMLCSNSPIRFPQARFRGAEGVEGDFGAIGFHLVDYLH